MRLIDADAFKEYICNAYEQVKHMYPDGGEWARQITEDFCKDIDEQPTIDIFNNSNTLGALDCVDRQKAIDLVESFYKIDKSVLNIMVFKLKQLPSVQPEEVIPHRNYKYLSDYWCECGWHLGKKGEVKYCSDCGRKVKWDE